MLKFIRVILAAITAKIIQWLKHGRYLFLIYITFQGFPGQFGNFSLHGFSRTYINGFSVTFSTWPLHSFNQKKGRNRQESVKESQGSDLELELLISTHILLTGT